MKWNILESRKVIHINCPSVAFNLADEQQFRDLKRLDRVKYTIGAMIILSEYFLKPRYYLKYKNQNCVYCQFLAHTLSDILVHLFPVLYLYTPRKQSESILIFSGGMKMQHQEQMRQSSVFFFEHVQHIGSVYLSLTLVI